MERKFGTQGLPSAKDKREEQARDLVRDAGMSTDFIRICKELGTVGDLMGREFEVCDAKGDLLFLVRQKPLRMGQVKALGEELSIISAQDFLFEMAEAQKNKVTHGR